MHTELKALAAIALLGLAGCELRNQEAKQEANAAASTEPMIVRTAVDSTLQWSACPAPLPAGCELAVLHGDPAKPNTDALLRVPAGYAIPPHTHPKPEIVTIISGTFILGMGNVADKAKAKPLPAGSFFAFEPGMAHYAFTDEETVVQINSTGPWGVDYVNPKDDPRQKAK